jgi:hypothetical protein
MISEARLISFAQWVGVVDESLMPTSGFLLISTLVLLAVAQYGFKKTVTQIVLWPVVIVWLLGYIFYYNFMRR